MTNSDAEALARAKLLPCPFCGAAPEWIADDSYNGEHAMCGPCDLGFVGQMGTGTAAVQWNRRADSSLAARHAVLRAAAQAVVREAATIDQDLGRASRNYTLPDHLIHNLRAALQEPAP